MTHCFMSWVLLKIFFIMGELKNVGPQVTNDLGTPLPPYMCGLWLWTFSCRHPLHSYSNTRQNLSSLDKEFGVLFICLWFGGRFANLSVKGLFPWSCCGSNVICLKRHWAQKSSAIIETTATNPTERVAHHTCPTFWMTLSHPLCMSARRREAKPTKPKASFIGTHKSNTKILAYRKLFPRSLCLLALKKKKIPSDCCNSVATTSNPHVLLHQVEP